MKVQREPVFFTCTTDELEGGFPPVVDENGVAPPENAICELLNSDNTVTNYFQWVGGEWFRYGKELQT